MAAIDSELRTRLPLIERTETCWLWHGQTNAEGYAVISSGGRRLLLHRLVFEITRRPLEAGEVVRHRWDVCLHRSCVRPAHLEAGTQADNMADVGRRRRAGLPSTSGGSRASEFRARRRAAIANSL